MMNIGRVNGSRKNCLLGDAKSTHYDKEGSQRVVARGTFFVSQKRVAEKGTRERDNWEDMNAPTTYIPAMRQAGLLK